MYKHKNADLTSYSQNLRKAMTKEERKLWFDFLKKLPITVNRQKVIGRYIVDFYIADSNVAIEIDGSQHYDDDGIESDKQRDEYLTKCGLKVIRYSNFDVNKNFESVCMDILEKLDLKPSCMDVQEES